MPRQDFQTTLRTGNLQITVRREGVAPTIHRTCIRLEPEYWDAFKKIAQIKRMTIHELASVISATRSPRGSFTSAVRVYIVNFLRHAADMKDAA